MLTSCPHCHAALHFTEGKTAKIRATLESLQEGKVLKLSCPQCKEAIPIDRGGNPVTEHVAASPSRPAKRIEPPAPPDLSWLASGEFESRDFVEDVPKVLLLISDEGLRDVIGETFSDIGYMPFLESDVEAAMDRMRFESFKGVVYHTSFEGKALSEAVFHQHMANMAMSHRRYIYYILLGPELHTLYDLEALALSANLVVNDRDVTKFELILRKGLTEYEMLFGPYLNAMREYGKK